jgi:hypothetical protein
MAGGGPHHGRAGMIGAIRQVWRACDFEISGFHEFTASTSFTRDETKPLVFMVEPP